MSFLKIDLPKQADSLAKLYSREDKYHPYKMRW